MIPIADEPSPHHRTPFVTIALILINVAVYFMWQAQIGVQQSIYAAAFIPIELTKGIPFANLHILTAMFMHGGLMHLLGNMWFLWIFGDNVESAMSPVRYAIFYLLCGYLATRAYVLTDPNSTVPLVGASGAVSAVLGAYLVMHPHARIRAVVPIFVILQFVTIPAWIYLFVWIGFQVMSEAAMQGHKEGGGVAYAAHIGGFIAGMALVFLFRKAKRRRGIPAIGMSPG